MSQILLRLIETEGSDDADKRMPSRMTATRAVELFRPKLRRFVSPTRRALNDPGFLGLRPGAVRKRATVLTVTLCTDILT